MRIWSPNLSPAMEAGEPLATKHTNTPLLTENRLSPHLPLPSLHRVISRTPTHTQQSLALLVTTCHYLYEMHQEAHMTKTQNTEHT